MLKIIKSLFRKKEEYKVSDRFRVRTPQIALYRNDNTERTITTDMIVIVWQIGKKEVLCRIACNYDQIWSMKKLQHARNGDIVKINKEDFKTNYRKL